MLNLTPGDLQVVFPQAGVRARRFTRFERDFRAWLATPEGEFATWGAAQAAACATFTSPGRTAPPAPDAPGA